MKIIGKILKYSILKTLYFNFKYFSFFQAIKFPVLISRNVYLKEVKGKVFIKQDVTKIGRIIVGSYGVGIFDEKRSRAIWQVSGTVVFEGKCSIGHGSKISVAKEAILTLGNNFKITAESSIVCTKNIKIGHNCLMSWDILIMDTDFHLIKNLEGEILNQNSSIIVEDHVWIGCRSVILKGSYIPKNSIVGAGSILSKKMVYENSLYLGAPCRFVKDKVMWEE